jgi:NADH-quinone oxidoreductase subunit G
VLDEIHRLVPGYTGLSRLTLAAGNDQHLEPAAPAGLVQIDLSSHAGLTLPSGDGLFASGTLGRYCSTLGELADAHPQSAEMAADASA